MSAVAEGADMMCCCAACGTAGVDGIKLKKCNACYLVRYCGVKCQNEHRLQHKRECKKRVAELRDEILFKQPERSHLGDCPICFLPLPIVELKSTMMPCCSKTICDGCDYANQVREMEGKRQPKCPFCRHPAPKSKEETKKNLMKRVEANDQAAMCHVGSLCFHDGDYNGAFEYWIKAAGLGDVGAQFELSLLYRDGQGVKKDRKKQMYLLEEAAICGHPNARYNLGNHECRNSRHDRAAKHYIIAANLGHEGSLQALKKGFKAGWVSKADFAAALRGHQAAINATKSPQRDEAEAFIAHKSAVN